MRLGMVTDGEFVKAFSQLMNSPSPIPTAYALLILNAEVKKHMTDFDALRLKLISKYGEADAEGNIIVVKSEDGKLGNYKMRDSDGFIKEYNELVNLEVPVSRIPLSAVEHIQLPPTQLSILLASVILPDK